jgi:hypothetical protein
MSFYWIKDRVKQGKFNVYWGTGYQNLADYFTKHHSQAHHKRMLETCIHADKQPLNRKGIHDSALRGCVNTSGKIGAQILHHPLGDKLLPLPQPPVRACTDTRTNPSAQRATQLRRVLARVYAVSMQNQITTNVP